MRQEVLFRDLSSFQEILIFKIFRNDNFKAYREGNTYLIHFIEFRLIDIQKRVRC